MPWQFDGTFLRVNPDYDATPAGELWGQDLASTPSIKIVASRHDFHDQDLGDGIAACLNLDGLNQMRSILDMGNFEVVNIADASFEHGAASFGQIAGAIDYVDGTSTLSLYNNYGALIDSTQIIAGGGGGTGTVTGVTGDIDTIVCNPATITETGTISLALADTPGQSYSNGIGQITIDNYGRVTQVTGNYGGGTSPPTDLSYSRSQTTFTLKSSTGNDTDMPMADQNWTGMMSRVSFLKLDSLDDEAVRITGAQTIAGIKTFSATETDVQGQLFVGNGLTTDQEVRMQNLPVGLGATTQIGDLYIDGEFIKIRIV